MSRSSTTLCLLALAGSLTACQGNRSDLPPVHLIQNMDFQARFDAQEENEFFREADCARAVNHDCKGRAMRPPVPGTVAVGFLKDDDELHRGRGADGRLFDRLPASITLGPELLDRGRERYNIYCQPCHDEAGGGKGIATLRGGGFKVAPANLHDPRLRAMPLAYFYDVITNGKGTMLPYNAQIPVKDRWAIAAWVRTLQAARSPEEGK